MSETIIIIIEDETKKDIINIEPQYNYQDNFDPCNLCPNHISNGGSGICILGCKIIS